MAMDGWSRKEKLYILQGLNNLDFDKMEIKIPTRSREEIKNAVLHMVNNLAAAPRVQRVPISKLQQVVSITDDPNKRRLKSQLVRLLPNFNYIPPTMSVMNINIRELFEQIANAIEGKPVVADAATMEILHVIIEEVNELYGGYISPELKDFIARINSSAIPMPPSAARKEKQRSDPGGIHAPATTNISLLYTQANINNPPIYTTANTKINTPMHIDIPPMYPPANTNITSMYSTANTNILSIYPQASITNTNSSPLYPLANTNIPTMYSQANTNFQPMYTPVNTNIAPIYVCNIQPAMCEREPVYAPVNYNLLHPPPQIYYNAAYPPTMGNYNTMYSPPVYNLITPTNANCVRAPCVYDTLSVNTQGLLKPVMMPAHPPRASRPARSDAYHARCNGQYNHAMNRHGQ